MSWERIESFKIDLRFQAFIQLLLRLSDAGCKVSDSNGGHILRQFRGVFTGAGLLLFLLFCREGLAQTSNGTIAGAVIDATGAGVSQAVVTAHGVRTGFERKTKTNGVGGFRFESVLLDTYTVTAEGRAFRSAGLRMFW